MFLKALNDTVIKKQPVQSSTLPPSDKFPLTDASELEIDSYTKAVDGHLKIVLTKAVDGQKVWFAFGRHVTVIGSAKFGIQGADSVVRVTSDPIVDGATRLLENIKPAYWGRYFSGADFRGDAEYFANEENETLRNNNIRVLPVGRFTTQVGLGKAEGARDGKDQAGDLLATFGEDYLQSQGGEFYLFLDVEPTNPLSEDYYIGWSKAVTAISSKVKILPSVYLGAKDSVTSENLQNAISNGAVCHGLWIAFYKGGFRQPAIEAVLDFDSDDAKPVTTIDSPVLFWQYAGEIGQNEDFDFNVSNPDIDVQEILKRLILPPA